MIPFVLAIFITAAVAPLVDFQVTRWRFPNWIAVLTTLLLVLAVLTLLGVVLIVAVQTMVHAASEYSKQVVALTERAIRLVEVRTISISTRLASRRIWKAACPESSRKRPVRLRRSCPMVFWLRFLSCFCWSGGTSTIGGTTSTADIEATIRGYITTATAISA